MKKMATEGVGTGARSPALNLVGTVPALTDTSLLALHRAVRGCLCVGTLVNRFALWLEEYIPAVAVEYCYPEENIQLVSAEPKRHSVHYVLRLEQRYLGEMTISAPARMPEGMLQIQEQAIGEVIHGIRSAVDHLVLEKVVYRDSLTGAMNRTALDNLLPQEVERAQRYDYDLSVLMIDIDHFMALNERLGHVGADEVLRGVSQEICRQLRSSDLVFRYGGDEFLAILPGTGLRGAQSAARLVLAAVGAREVPGLGGEVPQLSIGVTCRRQGEGCDALFRRVDAALFEAKKNGRNCIRG